MSKTKTNGAEQGSLMDEVQTLEELIKYTPPTAMRNFIPVSFAGGISAVVDARQRVINNEDKKSSSEQGLVRLYDPIGGSFGLTAKAFGKMVDEQEGDFTLAINSEGGALFEGMAMSNTLRRYDRGRISAEVDGYAASAATIVAMGADEIAATPETRYLIHRVSLMATGNVDELQSFLDEATELDAAIARMYSIQSSENLTEKQAYDLMVEDKFMSADKALEYGLIDRVIERGVRDSKVSNSARVLHFRRIFDVFGNDFIQENAQ